MTRCKLTATRQKTKDRLRKSYINLIIIVSQGFSLI